jgi:hypothetical protein
MLNEQQAIETAKQVAAKEGWTWKEPVRARLQGGARKAWEILSNSQSRGVNVQVVLDAETGEIIRKGYNPR